MTVVPARREDRPASDESVAGPFSVTVDADPARLGDLRTMLRDRLTDLGVPGDLVLDVVVATGEACANAIEHAYGLAGDGVIELTVAKSTGRLEVTVRDHGTWRNPRGTNRGLGLPMMRRLATSVELARTSGGTRVRLAWKWKPDGDVR